MDVHFSLPRPEDTNARCDKDKNQVGHVVLNDFSFSSADKSAGLNSGSRARTEIHQ